ncbi:hypothetical protein ACFX12_012149 [Malus domestica]
MSQSPWNVSGNIGKEDGGMLASDEVGNLHEVDKKVGKIMQRVYLEPVPGEVGKLDAAFAMSEKAGNEFNVDVESVSSEHPMSDQSGRGDDDLNIGKLYSDVPHPPSPLSSPPSAGPRSISATISSPLPAEAGGLQRGADGDIRRICGDSGIHEVLLLQLSCLCPSRPARAAMNSLD